MGRRKRGKERETADEVKDSLKERDSRQDVLDDDSGLDTISRVQNWLSLDSPLKTRVFLSITALGVSSIITQLLIMREFMSVFHGNELVFGIILASHFN